MLLTAATILFILFWVHQHFQLGVPDEALIFLRCKINFFGLFIQSSFSTADLGSALFADHRFIFYENLLRRWNEQQAQH